VTVRGYSRPVSARSALVIATGAQIDRVRAADRADLVICADGGLDAAVAADRHVDVVVGDLDSVSTRALADATAAGVRVERHRIDKDESDLELALLAAVDRSADTIAVHLGVGGRLDHQLANLLVLASPRWSAAEISAVIGDSRAWVVREKRRVLPLVPGEPLALHAVGGPALGVHTGGLRFDLHGERLDAMVARGIANEVATGAPTIAVDSGVVLAISSPTP
jgi:thiamine pyrophosphokinase